jgi:alanyl-tRNA synthetase
MSITVKDIRSKFIDYFVKNSHEAVHSSPLIPHNDPTMMFVNSGMVQFKNVFTGLEKRSYNKATSCQKSVRAGGKHNDLENVGYTARHHTFFEMLGNFSFGDYFKESAINYAWDLLTKDFSIPKEKLYVTVYHTDYEAAELWKKIANLSDDRIIKIKTNDNFWSMGDTGPCGPCSEIFYDHGDHIKGGLPGTPEEDGDRYIEIWNMVFMQYEQVDKETRIELPKKSIDTGMGLERIAALLQNVHDNYDIDLFTTLIDSSENLTSTKAEGERKFSHRVIADHLRSSSFLIADGVMPSNEGRGYVLRRIMRRAMRHAHQLGAKEPLLYRMLPTLISLMGDAYPELKRAENLVKEVLKTEEERFKTTLDRGLKLLEDEVQKIYNGDSLGGDVAFKLYDTYGFPLDLTEDILKKKNIAVDIAKFESCMEEQKERARKNWAGSGESKTDKVWFDLKEKFGSTEFLGYSHNQAEGVVLALVKDGQIVEKLTAGDSCVIISNQTPFYGESGGQMGDIGTIYSKNFKAEIIDTKKYLGSIIAHHAIVKDGTVSAEEIISLEINLEYRNSLKRNHSATHILHSVLREVLGDHVTQKGSLVASDRLRFDISHPKQISKSEIDKIELSVNQVILDNSEVNTKLMQIDDAIKSGAMALFGEKYDDEVRVVSMGSKAVDLNFSVELCGGTHVRRTGDIGLFKIIAEYAVSAGVRRIEAITGLESLKKFSESEELTSKIAEEIKSSKNEVLEKLKDLVNSKKDLEKENSDLKISISRVTKEEFIKNSSDHKGYKILVKSGSNIDSKVQRAVCEQVLGYDDNVVFLFISENSGKVSIIASCGQEASKKVLASDIVKIISEKTGGAGGGGSAKIAQAGGIKTLHNNDYYDAIFSYINNIKFHF